MADTIPAATSTHAQPHKPGAWAKVWRAVKTAAKGTWLFVINFETIFHIVLAIALLLTGVAAVFIWRNLDSILALMQ